jgi:hypothetical protein
MSEDLVYLASYHTSSETLSREEERMAIISLIRYNGDGD